jgi:hypothetical protein
MLNNNAFITKLFRRQQESVSFSSRKMHDIFVRFKPNVGFFLHSFVKVRKVKLTDICPLGAALMHADGQTDSRERT